MTKKKRKYALLFTTQLLKIPGNNRLPFREIFCQGSGSSRALHGAQHPCSLCAGMGMEIRAPAPKGCRYLVFSWQGLQVHTALGVPFSLAHKLLVPQSLLMMFFLLLSQEGQTFYLDIKQFTSKLCSSRQRS